MFGGFDLGKMLSGEGGGGLGGMFGGGSIMNMVKSQLASHKNIKMLSGKVVEMADMLCQKFNEESAQIWLKDFNESYPEGTKEDFLIFVEEKRQELRESIKAAATQRKAEIEAEYNAKSEEDKAASRESTQLMINDVFKEANRKLNEIIITKYDITLVSKLKPISAKNEKGELMLVAASNGSGSMVELKEDVVFIEIHAKGIIKQELRLDEFLLNMLAESPGEG